MKRMTSYEAARNGFAAYNHGTHLCIDLGEELAGADGRWVTISVKAQDGKRTTFAFAPRCDDEPGFQCIDIVCHDTERTTKDDQPIQRVNVLGAGPTYYTTGEDEATIVSVLT